MPSSVFYQDSMAASLSTASLDNMKLVAQHSYQTNNKLTIHQLMV